MSRSLTIAALTEHPWALTRSRLQQLVDAVTAGPGTLLAAAPARSLAPKREGTVAVIPIHGEISHRASWLTEFFGGTSIDSIRAAFREAINAPDVLAVVLDIDSPGGTIPGNTELAAEIRAARGAGKPIIAVSNATMASAAYWIGSQADEVWVTPSGQVGSIGVFAVHEDISDALAQDGIKVTILRSADFKAEGNPYEPLSDDVKAHLQARVDAMDRQFVADVAKGRNVAESVVRETYGQGRMLMAQEALEAGMVDGIASLETVIRSVAKATKATAARTVRATDGSPEPRAAGDAVAADDEAGEAIPFRVRAEQLAAELVALVTHAEARAALRAKEGRPAFGPDTLASLRATRDALTELLPVDPAEAVHAQAPAVDPPAPPAPVVPEPKPAPVPQRFAAPGSWDRYIQQETSYR